MKIIVQSLLAWSARFYVQRTKPYIIGITGSVGKTTCRMIVTQLFHQVLPALRVRTSKKNFNTEVGLCLAILGIEEYAPTIRGTIKVLVIAFWRACGMLGRSDVLVLEYGIDHPGDMDVLLDIAIPHMSMLTAVDSVHASYFADKEAIFTEKVKLLLKTREVAFRSADLEPWMKQIELSCDGLTFALHEDENQTNVGFNSYQLWRYDEQVGSSFIVCEGEERMSTIKTNLFGHEHAGYVSLAYEIVQIVAHRLGVSYDSRQRASLDLSFQLQSGRSSWLLGKRGSLLLDSSYNASPQSMHSLIELITQIRQELFPERRLVFCLGDMRELGSYSDEAHDHLVAQILHADKIFLIGEEMRRIVLPALLHHGYRHDRVERFEQSKQLGESLDIRLGAQQHLALVLFKGSQNTLFLEEAVKQVLRYPADKTLLCRQEQWCLAKKG